MSASAACDYRFLVLSVHERSMDRVLIVHRYVCAGSPELAIRFIERVMVDSGQEAVGVLCHYEGCWCFQCNSLRHF